MIPNIAIRSIGFALVFGSGVYSGYKVTTASYLEQEVSRQQEVSKALLERDKALAEAHKQYQANLYKAEKEKEDAIKKLKFDYDTNRTKRLSIKTACSSTGTSTVADGSTVTDERVTTTIYLPAKVNDDLWRLAYEADEIVESYRALQHWVIYNKLYQE